MKDSTSGPGSVASPDGGPGCWRPYSGGYFMRTDVGEHGKLARLADVRDWLMTLHEWPMDKAADEVVSRLQQAHSTGLELFVSHPKSYALPLRPDAHMLSLEEVEQRGGLRHLDERLQGFEGVCNAILNGWIGEYRGYLRGAPRVDAVCVRTAVAHELWGWGSVAGPVVIAVPVSPFPLADFAALVAYRNAQKTANTAAGKPRKNIPWSDGNQLDVLHAEYKRLGKNIAAAESMGKALGCTRQAIDSALNKEWAPTVADPFRSISAA